MDFKITDYCLFVEDIERSTAFYHDILGLELKRRDLGFSEFLTGEATLALWEAADFRKNVGKNILSLQGHRCIGAFEFEKSEELMELYHRLKGLGVEFATEMVDWPWGARAAYFKDPDGFLWEIYAWVGTPYTW
ncbi:MAG: VOC family protein [Anaerolineaceae bacterium]